MNHTKREEQLLLRRKKRKRWQKVVRVLACMVVFCTTYALILPAITMVRTEKVLTCPVNVHKHEESCYDKDHKLICGRADFVVHSHDENCYDKDGNLTCALPEIEAHVHDDSCYKEEKVLVCVSGEGDGHHHTDECYRTISDDDFAEVDQNGNFIFSDFTTDRELICGREETDVNHKHTDACYEMQKVLTCRNQAILHKHDKEKCYEKIEHEDETVEYRLICPELEVLEHRHEDGCFTVVEKEEPEEGEKTDENLPIIIEEESSEIAEGIEAEDPDGKEVAEGIETENPDDVEITEGIEAEDPEGEEATDEAGEENPDGEETTDETEEENPDDEEIAEELDAEFSDELPTYDYVKVFEGPDYTITVQYNEDAEIPEEAKLQVREILEDTEEYQEYYQQAADALAVNRSAEELLAESNQAAAEAELNGDIDFDQGDQVELNTAPNKNISFARFFDISFVKDEETYEPAVPVDVTIQYQEAVAINEAGDAAVVHFAETGTEVIEVETSQEVLVGENMVDTFSFTQDSFSVTGTVITENFLPIGDLVIFMKGSDGNYYAISKDGSAVRVTYDEATQTVYCEENTKDIIWSFTENNGDDLYFQNSVDKSKYLTMNQNGMRVANSRTAIHTDHDNSGRWYIYYDYTERVNLWQTRTTRYYLNCRNANFAVSTTNQQVYYATTIVYSRPVEPPPLLDTGAQRELEGNYEHNKNIDYLGDGAINPNTTLIGEDLYRLSLDMTGMKKPVDLLLVVDASGSMKGNKEGDGYTHGMPEVIKFLNGARDNGTDYDHTVNSFNDPNSDGFIQQFFELNNQNRMAIAAFGGYDPDTDTYTSWSSYNKYEYINDAWKIKGWNTIGQTYTSVPVAQGYYPDTTASTKPNRTYSRTGTGLFIEDDKWVQGTNYSAGLMVAEDMWDELGPDDGSRIRVMVFLSDGQPTYSIVPTTDSLYQIYTPFGYHYRRRGQGQERYYQNDDVSTATGTPKTNDTYYDSEGTFENFRANHGEVINYSIGFKVEEGKDQVLRYIGSTDAARTNAENYKQASKYTDIMDMILGVFRPRDVEITDLLSENVSFYESQPDVKVIMTPKNGGSPILLWEGYNNGQGTTNNYFDYKQYDSNNILRTQRRYIVKGVTYQDGQISVQFDEHYTLDQDYMYSLSFNVKATDQAYDTYAAADGSYPVQGDSSTDANGNATSSEHGGLYSNAAAAVSFINHEEEKEKEVLGYRRPVIQVDRCELTLTKVDQYGAPLEGAVFTLTDETGTAKTYTTDADGTVTIPSHDLLTGCYSLAETQAPGDCTATEETIAFQVSRGMILPTEGPDLMTAAQSLEDWKCTAEAQKNIGKNDNLNTYPKDNLYPYGLEITNKRIPKEYEIIVQKTNTSGEPLPNAVFDLYRKLNENELQTDVDTGLTVQINHETKPVQLLAGGLVSDRQQITQEEPQIWIDAVIYHGIVQEGTYYLVETSAPEGYNSLKEPIVIEITNEGVTYFYKGTEITDPVPEAGEISSVRIQNTDGYSLPHTGGAGTTIFTMGGLLFISISLLYGFILRRKWERRIQ